MEALDRMAVVGAVLLLGARYRLSNNARKDHGYDTDNRDSAKRGERRRHSPKPEGGGVCGVGAVGGVGWGGARNR
ncbi:hypothetical protein RE428_22390 [Marinobacter nanhaiticus D15-8W]|nr:hypothetical protein RE428_22390 [Marinobacter nanhaiticus D15-8W]